MRWRIECCSVVECCRHQLLSLFRTLTQVGTALPLTPLVPLALPPAHLHLCWRLLHQPLFVNYKIVTRLTPSIKIATSFVQVTLRMSNQFSAAHMCSSLGLQRPQSAACARLPHTCLPLAVSSKDEYRLRFALAGRNGMPPSAPKPAAPAILPQDVLATGFSRRGCRQALSAEAAPAALPASLLPRPAGARLRATLAARCAAPCATPPPPAATLTSAAGVTACSLGLSICALDPGLCPHALRPAARAGTAPGWRAAPGT